MHDRADLDTVAELAAQLRVDSIRTSTSAGSGPPTSSMSPADLLAVLVARHLRDDWGDPEAPANDHLIFSKGHASPLLYSVFKAVGVVSEDELMTGYRRFGERLQGHPTPQLPWVDVATGSLGQGLPDAVGIALAGRRLERRPYRVWVLCGDSEMAEGSMWEALDKASYYELANLVAIIDVNRLGQRGPTELGWDLRAYARRAEAFGAHAIEVDGHDLAAIDSAFAAVAGDRPTVILARTVKGRGFSEVEDSPDWHGKPFPADMAERAIAALGGVRNHVLRGPRPVASPERRPAEPHARDGRPLRYAVGDMVATRKAYGDALVALGGRDPRVVALDAEVGNSTHAIEFARAYPGRYFEMFIAEQQLVAAATGLSVRGYRAFASTFAAFLMRAHDFIRMAAVSGVDVRLAGSHAGVEIGADGPSQMALEDLAMMRALHGSTVLYPATPRAPRRSSRRWPRRGASATCAPRAARIPSCIPRARHSRSAARRVLHGGDDVTLVGAGVTLHACLRAAESLERAGIHARVIDCDSIKPIDDTTLAAAAAATSGRIVVAEDHRPEGGLGSAVAESLLAGGATGVALAHLAVRGMPPSGPGEELMAWAGIDAGHIARAARRLLGRTTCDAASVKRLGSRSASSAARSTANAALGGGGLRDCRLGAIEAFAQAGAQIRIALRCPYAQGEEAVSGGGALLSGAQESLDPVDRAAAPSLSSVAPRIRPTEPASHATGSGASGRCGGAWRPAARYAASWSSVSCSSSACARSSRRRRSSSSSMVTAGMGGEHDAPDLVVDRALGALADRRNAGQERPLRLVGLERERAELTAHTPAGHHRVRDLGELPEVGLGAGAQVPDMICQCPLAAGSRGSAGRETRRMICASVDRTTPRRYRRSASATTW